MAKPKFQFGAQLKYGSGPTTVPGLMTCSASRGTKGKTRIDDQSDSNEQYGRAKGKPPEWSFSCQLDKTDLAAMYAQLDTDQPWIYVDEDGGTLTCSSGWLSDLSWSTNNGDELAIYNGIVVCNVMPSYSAGT